MCIVRLVRSRQLLQQFLDGLLDFANCDHEVAAKAIAAGFSQREGETPAFWIHTSGSMILAWETLQKKCLGELLPKVYNDWDGVGELVSLPDFAAHRVVDKMVLACPTTTPRVKIAIVCPPTIYGPGRGPDNQRSMQAYEAARCVLERKQGFLPCAGKSIWHQVHVQDLSDLYLSLGEAAAEGGGKATWNQEGYYLAENGAFAWGDVFKSITAIAMKKGLIEKEGTPEEPPEELEKLTRAGHRMWATNSRGESLRGRNLLGWKPYRRSLLEELPDIVEGEARSLGLIQGHAAKVTQ